MASSAVGKRDSRNAPAAPNQQVFRRERSFVVQRPAQQAVPAGNVHFQQRERSFIRDGNRSMAAGFSPSFQQNNNFGSNGGVGGGKSRGGNGSAAGNKGSKPNMEIYRPPGVRSSVIETGGRASQYFAEQQHQHPRLTKSRTSLELNNNNGSKMASKVISIQLTPTIIAPQPSAAGEGREAAATSHFALQRSKSSGSHLSLQQQKVPVPTPLDIAASFKLSSNAGNGELPDVTQFPDSAQVLLRKIAVDPDAASSRSVMDAVRILCSRVIESSRYASSIARYCAYVIEKESRETFRESLLNTCQESFQERDRILRSAAGSSQRWVAFINFLNEMYLQLKRLNLATKTRSSSTTTRLAPELVLLTLLAESCCATLRQPSAHSLQELECLFFVLTGIGRDVENELPGKMAAIWNAIRDAFLDMNLLPGAAQRTLLQLVELRAAKWQLPATAVTYYYPSVSGAAY